MEKYVVPTATFYWNGDKVANFLSTDFQEMFWSVGTFHDMMITSSVKDVSDKTLYATYSGYFTVDGSLVPSGRQGQFPFTCGATFIFNDAGIIKEVDQTCSDFSPLTDAYAKKTEFDDSNWNLVFSKAGPRNEAPNTLKRFGMPDYVDLEAGGFLGWLTPGFCFDEAYLDDIEVSNPARNQYDIPNEKDFLTTYTSASIPSSKLDDVLSLNPAIQYNAFTKTLVVRANNLASNVILTYEALRVADGVTVAKAQQDGKKLQDTVYVTSGGSIVLNPDSTPKYTAVFQTLKGELCSLVNKFSS